jgi:hypothetical protein
MKVKIFEIRDAGTFIPVICIHPTPDNEEQRYLLCRDGYSGTDTEHYIIMIDAQCSGCSYGSYSWVSRTKRVAHTFIQENWYDLCDGDVIDVEYILGETTEKKISERLEHL